MKVTLTILRYRKRFIPFALLAMALFRIPLWFNKRISFWKLMGSGQNGTFDKKPDWQQWGILTVENNGFPTEPMGNDKLLKELYGPFISKWIHLFHCETWTVLLEPLESRGSWDGKKVFGDLQQRTDYEGPIAILTRATIRLSRINQFWSHVDGVADQMTGARGFIMSLGIGELPWIKQATFSVWQNLEAMKEFAYGMKEHTKVIRLTREEKWYSEEMFTRFKIAGSSGTLRGKDPLAGMT